MGKVKFLSEVVAIVAVFLDWIMQILHMLGIDAFDEQLSNAIKELS